MSVKYSFEDHIINRQYEAEQAMLAKFEAGNYTIANPLVTYNAYLVNPLSAVVCFNTEKETAVTVTVLGKTPQGNISHTFPKAKKHVLPIVGLYSDYQNRIEIRAYRGESNIITIDVPDVFDGKEVILWIPLLSIYRTTSSWYLRQARIWQSDLTMRVMRDGI